MEAPEDMVSIRLSSIAEIRSSIEQGEGEKAKRGQGRPP
jgi:hypothetical protein